jgi:hypothetical protein
MSGLYDLTRPLGSAEQPECAGTTEVLAHALVHCTFLECLERSPLGELWKIRDADDRTRVAFYLRAGEGVGQDWRLDRLRLFAHPDLPGYEIVEADPGRTVLLSEGYDQTLQERFEELWGQHQPGIPRAELLGYLRTAAEALDGVFVENGFQHLGLSPRTLWLKQGRLCLGGFGLIHLLWLPTGRPVTELNERYSAPELYRGHVSRRCDQYSLALIFAELLTGVHPHDVPARQRRQARGKLDLHLLSTADQEVLARALHSRPSQRFPSCVALLSALEEAPVAPLMDRNVLRVTLPPVLPAGAAGPLFGSPSRPSLTLPQFVRELVALAAGPAQLTDADSIHYRLEPGQNLEHHCAVELFPGAIALKLEGFGHQWDAQRTVVEPERFRFEVDFPAAFWQRLTGQRIGLGIDIQLRPSQRSSARLTEVSVVIRPFGCNRTQANRLLAENGPVLLESVRNYLQACPEQRGQDRLTIRQPLRVSPVLAGQELAPPVECVGKDISTHGIGFYLPHPPCTAQVYINLPQVPQVAAVAGLAHIVRGHPCGDGWYEVGAFFIDDGATHRGHRGT